MTVLIDEIREFIISQEGEMKIPMTPISKIEEIFESQGYEMEDLDDNTNGWEIDFWYYFKHPEKARYCLSGSLWSGGFKIYKNASEL